jgi:hypothetical protein
MPLQLTDGIIDELKRVNFFFGMHSLSVHPSINLLTTDLSTYHKLPTSIFQQTVFVRDSVCKIIIEGMLM